MKYILSAVFFLSFILSAIFFTPASQAYTTFYVGTSPGSYRASPIYPGNHYYPRHNYCPPRRIYPYSNYNYPAYYQPYGHVYVEPQTVIIDDTGAYDDVYGPGASAARRLEPARNTNIYHGW